MTHVEAEPAEQAMRWEALALLSAWGVPVEVYAELERLGALHEVPRIVRQIAESVGRGAEREPPVR